MAIDIKDLIEQAVDIAAERRQRTLSEHEAEKVKGGISPTALKLPYPIILGIYLPPDKLIQVQKSSSAPL